MEILSPPPITRFQCTEVIKALRDRRDKKRHLFKKQLYSLTSKEANELEQDIIMCDALLEEFKKIRGY